MQHLFDSESEKAVLVLLLNKSDLIYFCDLEPEDFYNEKNREIYKLIKKQQAEGKPFDYFALSELVRNNSLFAHLAQIQDYLLQASQYNFEDYIKIIKERRMKRELYFKLLEYKKRIEENQEYDIENILDDLERTINYKNKYNIKPFKTLLYDWWENKITKGEVDYIKSNFSTFDKKFNGFTKGTLNIIACRPSIGKTTLAIQLAYNFVTQGHGVCFFSLEMSYSQIINRLVSQNSGIDHNIVASGDLSDNNKINEILSAISEYNLFIVDESNVSLNQIEKMANIYKNKHNIDVLIIDYLTLLDMPAGEKKTDRIGEVTRRLKLLAKKLNIVVILLSQLNRNTEVRDEKRPHLADLRDSGNIEQDADTVILLWRKPNEKSLPSDKTELIMAKNRDGAIGVVNMIFKSNILKFEETDNE